MAAVTKTLGDLSSRSQRADELEKTLAEGQMVVDLDVSAIDPSFVQDRMEGDIGGLLLSIREQGQQVPVLVRPHPDQPSRYQMAFGHRRLRALKELDLPVKAVVRELTDEQLVIAQGQENNERRDLTFIEKARFAERLHKQFARDVITSAMSVPKSDLSTMLSIVGSLPNELINAIGPAPGVGRPSWLKMVELFKNPSLRDDLLDYALTADVQALPSADRFKALLVMKPQPAAKSLPAVLSTSAGMRVAQVVETKTTMDIKIDKRAAPEFAAFVRENLLTLFEEHQANLKLEIGE